MNLKGKIINKKAFLWDFDGCFCNSEPFHYLAYNMAFAKFGHTINELEYYESFTHHGSGTEKEIKKYNLSCSVAEIMSLKSEFYFQQIATGKISLFPEIPQIVLLLQQLGAKIGIASNSSETEIRTILAHTNTNISLDFIVGKLAFLQKKPAPDIFLYAIAKLGISPCDAMVFEDSNRGLLAANAAGCEAICMRTEYNKGLNFSANYVAEFNHAELLKALS